MRVDSAGNYAERIAAAKELFDRYNRRTIAYSGRSWAARDDVFRREAVRLLRGLGRRRGRTLQAEGPLPEEVFLWENYLLACGPCNGGKNNRFSVVRGGRLVEVTRRRGDPIRRPRSGPPAPINPRDEEPLTFLDLEIVDTFMFLPREGLSEIDEARAGYTIEVLKLNRDVLLAARREAYGGVQSTGSSSIVSFVTAGKAMPYSEGCEKPSRPAPTRRYGGRCSASNPSSTSCAPCSRRSPKPWPGDGTACSCMPGRHSANSRTAPRSTGLAGAKKKPRASRPDWFLRDCQQRRARPGAFRRRPCRARQIGDCGRGRHVAGRGFGPE